MEDVKETSYVKKDVMHMILVLKLLLMHLFVLKILFIHFNRSMTEMLVITLTRLQHNMREQQSELGVKQPGTT